MHQTKNPGPKNEIRVLLPPLLRLRLREARARRWVVSLLEWRLDSFDSSHGRRGRWQKYKKSLTTTWTSQMRSWQGGAKWVAASVAAGRWTGVQFMRSRPAGWLRGCGAGGTLGEKKKIAHGCDCCLILHAASFFFLAYFPLFLSLRVHGAVFLSVPSQLAWP